MIVPKDDLGIPAWPRINTLLICAILVLVQLCNTLKAVIGGYLRTNLSLPSAFQHMVIFL